MIRTINNGRVGYKSIEGRSRQRNKKSIYYDRHTNTMAAASKLQHGQACYLRPNRYLFLGQWTCIPSQFNELIVATLLSIGVNANKVNVIFK